MKIATYLNDKDEVTSPSSPGRVCVYEQVRGKWKNTATVSSDWSGATTVVEARMRLEEVMGSLEECRVFLLSEVTGFWNLLLASYGFQTWKSEGSLFEQLDNVESVMRQAAAAAESAAENAGCRTRRRRCVAPDDVEVPASLDLFVESDTEEGRFRIDLASVLSHRPELTSRQVLIPFLENRAFTELEICCSHLPRWFDEQLRRLGLTSRIEHAGETDDVESLRVIVAPLREKNRCAP